MFVGKIASRLEGETPVGGSDCSRYIGDDKWWSKQTEWSDKQLTEVITRENTSHCSSGCPALPHKERNVNFTTVASTVWLLSSAASLNDKFETK